jgi:2-methylcitrate dehydratase PrpD
MGMAARNGITAALLAAQDFGGPVGVFDRGHTVFEAFSRAPRPELLTEGLGEGWDGVTELAIKPYPCVSFLHPALDALFALVEEHQLRPGQIEANPLKSHCAQYVLPTALVRGRLEVADLFTDRRESDPQIRALSQRVRVEPDDGELEALFPDRYATEIELRTTSGKAVRRRNDIARGYPETPMSRGEIDAKFAALVGSVAPPQRIAALKSALAALPEADGLDDYADLLRAPVEGAKR